MATNTKIGGEMKNVNKALNLFSKEIGIGINTIINKKGNYREERGIIAYSLFKYGIKQSEIAKLLKITEGRVSISCNDIQNKIDGKNTKVSDRVSILLDLLNN